MKKITCSAVGGPCDHEIKGATKEEWMQNGMAHLKEAHPEMAADVEGMSAEENAEWMKKFDATWDAAPEMTEEEMEDEKEVVLM